MRRCERACVRSERGTYQHLRRRVRVCTRAEAHKATGTQRRLAGALRCNGLVQALHLRSVVPHRVHMLPAQPAPRAQAQTRPLLRALVRNHGGMQAQDAGTPLRLQPRQALAAARDGGAVERVREGGAEEGGKLLLRLQAGGDVLHIHAEVLDEVLALVVVPQLNELRLDHARACVVRARRQGRGRQQTSRYMVSMW